MIEKPEALRLADAEQAHNAGFVEASRIHGKEIARLRAENEALRAALKQAMPQLIGRPYLDAITALKEAK